MQLRIIFHLAAYDKVLLLFRPGEVVWVCLVIFHPVGTIAGKRVCLAYVCVEKNLLLSITGNLSYKILVEILIQNDRHCNIFSIPAMIASLFSFHLAKGYALN